jgi:anti-sigma factor RsiW
VAAAAAALVLAGTGLGWTLRGQVAPEMAGLPTAAEPAALHRLATGSALPVEAQASETDIAPWLAARLGEEMPLPDLAEFGFTLDAAWVLPGRRQAAILRYVDPDGVALSVWRQPDDKAEAQPLRCADGPGGLVTYTWADGQYRHAVSAILPRDRLRPMALAVERFMREAPRRALLAALPRRPCLTETG